MWAKTFWLPDHLKPLAQSTYRYKKKKKPPLHRIIIFQFPHGALYTLSSSGSLPLYLLRGDLGVRDDLPVREDGVSGGELDPRGLVSSHPRDELQTRAIIIIINTAEERGTHKN